MTIHIKFKRNWFSGVQDTRSQNHPIFFMFSSPSLHITSSIRQIYIFLNTYLWIMSYT